ncbi:MAG: acyl-[acyl-carrier-protein]--UDP-N-acetylglucosamine O-acyltransferase [Rhodobacteraceae bacterium]|nr:acyl-[acyl-carrier-protein]--UDP-N-acetylglucosamine O-acyltransferase [Paracoccaceae bacterium]
MTIHVSTKIHSSAKIDEGAHIGKNCLIGPFCSIPAGVQLEDEVELLSHVALSGQTFIGSKTKIWPFSSIGHQPQDLKFSGETSELIIGTSNKIRECVSINPGTFGGGGVTVVGNDCLFMLGSHVGHDCKLGNRIILANNAALAGHVVLEDGVHVGGLSGVHQFVRIGEGAFIGALSMVNKDVIPFGMVYGDRARLMGLNLVGLRRKGFKTAVINDLKTAYEDLFSEKGTLKSRLNDINPDGNPLVDKLLTFITGDNDRSLLSP